MSFNKEEGERYSRHFILEGFGETAQQKLKEARILVIGAGGLGCPALLYLAAAGAGTIGIVDDDTVSLSNLHRQVLFASDDIGKLKVDAASEKLRAQNPNILIKTYSVRLNTENALDIIGDFDVVLDGSDNFSTRYLVNDACVILGKPFVYAAISTYAAQLSVFNYKEGPTYRCLFPEAPAPGEVPTCAEAGVLGVLPGLAGTWQALEAIKIITGIGETLSGKLLCFDLLSNTFNTLNIKPVEENRNISRLGEYDFTCATDQQVDAAAFLAMRKDPQVQVLDVREKTEYDGYNVGGINIPLSELGARMDELEQRKTLVICRVGQRSQSAIELIRQHYPDMELYNLRNGILGLKGGR